MSDLPASPPQGEIPPEIRRRRFLFTNLVILGVFLLSLVFLVYSYPSLLAPAPTPTFFPTGTRFPTLTPSPTRPTSTITPTPTITKTSRPTFTPTITPSPSRTLTPTTTLTPPGPPTITAAQPLPTNALYSLHDWDAQDADELILRMEDVPNLLSEKARGEDNSGYYQAFSFPLNALREALLRFPDAPQAAAWKTRLAYDLALTSHPSAGEVYADLIVTALNQGDVTLENLPAWFKQLEPRLELDVLDLDPPEGYTSASLVEIRGPGSIFIRLVEKPGAYQGEALADYFNFSNPPDMQVILSDLTSPDGSGPENLALYDAHSPASLSAPAPRVFDLSGFPALELPFLPGAKDFPLGIDSRLYWAVQHPSGGKNDLVFRSTVFPSCPVTVERTYAWNGTAFEAGQPRFIPQPNLPTLNTCPTLVDHAAASWGPAGAAAVLEAILPNWPPEHDLEGNPYPDDARDEFRFRAGLYQALGGSFDRARETMQSLVDSPTIADSRWIQPAKSFSEAYQKPEDLYRACVGAAECDADLAIAALLDGLPASELPNAPEWFSRLGIAARSSGFFDFDGDGINERWFMVRNRPLEKLSLWILAAFKDTLDAVPLGTLDVDKPAFAYVDEEARPPVVSVDGQYGIQMVRDPLDGTPYVSRAEIPPLFPNRYQNALQAAEAKLWAGADLRDVRRDLITIQTVPGLVCRGTWSCDPYYYLLGLVNELIGDERAAVDAYLELWRNYSRSPYTTMARLKLAGGARPGTPTITPLATLTSTLRPTFTPILGTPGIPTPTEEVPYPYPSPYPEPPYP